MTRPSHIHNVLLASVTIGALAATMAISGDARADDPPVREEVTEGSAPNGYMLWSGVAVFGLSYGTSAVVAAESPLSQDRTLFVPIAGPWIDFANRPGCGGSGADCNAENAAKVGLIVDGVFQAIGALSVVGAFLSPEHKKVVQSATISVTPTYFAGGGTGLIAVGSF